MQFFKFCENEIFWVLPFIRCEKAWAWKFKYLKNVFLQFLFWKYKFMQRTFLLPLWPLSFSCLAAIHFCVFLPFVNSSIRSRNLSPWKNSKQERLGSVSRIVCWVSQTNNLKRFILYYLCWTTIGGDLGCSVILC